MQAIGFCLAPKLRAHCEAVQCAAVDQSPRPPKNTVSKTQPLCRSTLMVVTTPLKGPRRLALS